MGERLNLKRKRSKAFGKVKKNAPPSQPGLEPRYAAYMTDALPLELLGLAHIPIKKCSHPARKVSTLLVYH